MILSLQTAHAATWPDCGFQCTAGDVTLQKLYLGDASGNPLSPCSSGKSTTGYLWMTIYNNANSPRYGVILLADIYVNGALQSTLYPQGSCVLDSIQPKTTASYRIYNLNWICGQEVKLSRMVLSWETSSTTCSSARRDCANRGTKCNGGMTVDVAASIPLSINFTTNSPQCCCGNIAFADKTTGGVPPYRYDWNFGDGTPHDTASSTVHRYAMPGTYAVVLTVTDSAGSVTTSGKQITLYPRPAANITSNSPQCGYSPISFSGSVISAAAPYTYSWNFGDGKGSSTSQNPTYQYSSPGTYTVTLAVRDSNGCTDTTTKQVTVNPNPIAGFSSNSPQCSTGQITFIDASSGGTAPYTYDWDFGDGSPHSSDQNPVHNYGVPGNYTAALTVTNAQGCQDRTTRLITINAGPKADAGPDRSYIYGNSIIIGGTSSAKGGQAPYSYRWSPSSGLSDPQSPNPTASPASTTTYTLTVTDSNGCTSKDNMTLYKSDIRLSKQPSSSIVLVGQRIAYTYTVSNEGDTTVSISSLVDEKAGTVSNLNRTILRPGESASGSATYPVTSSDLPGPIAGDAVVSGTDDYGQKLSALGSATVSLDLGLVHPILECVRDDADGTYTAIFGYQSDGQEVMTIPVGDGNGFLPSPADRGQPTEFLPGRHPFVFSTKFDGRELIWWIGGHTVGASSISRRCSIPACSIDGPGSVCEDSSGIYTSSGSEIPPFSYSYLWSLDGGFAGDQRVLSLDGDRYSIGAHILNLAIGQSYNDMAVSGCNCSTAVTVEKHIDATMNIISVE